MSIELKVAELGQDRLHNHKLSMSRINIICSTDKDLLINMGQRTMPLPAQSHYIFYEQNNSFDAAFSANETTHLVLLTIPISELHKLLSADNDEVNFNAIRSIDSGSYHQFRRNHNQIQDSLEKIIDEVNPILMESHKFELLGHILSGSEEKRYQCPFLNQRENVQKVREAKQLLIKDIQNAPTIKELSKLVGLNEYNLKSGFKEIYGKPIYTFLKDHRLKYAVNMLTTNEMQVSEIAEAIGYTNVSHFIDAFKKKYGQTPKQFTLHQN